MLVLNKGNEKQNKVEIAFALFGTSLEDVYLGQPNIRIFQTRKLYLLKVNIFFLVVPKIFQRFMDSCKGWFAVGCCKL